MCWFIFEPDLDEFEQQKHDYDCLKLVQIFFKKFKLRHN